MTAMPARGFRTTTVTEAIYDRVKLGARKEGKSVATYVSEILQGTFNIEDAFANHVKLLELISLDKGEVVMRDNKKDRIVGVKAKPADGGKMKVYCELDGTDYRQHTAFAAALPQVRNAVMHHGEIGMRSR